MKCDTCLFSRTIVSENGFHSLCCRSDKEARECFYTGEHYVMHPKFESTKTEKQTNADRIRSMTDEELSSWINDHADCNSRCEAWKDGCMNSDSTCMAAWLAWLKEEVKDV